MFLSMLNIDSPGKTAEFSYIYIFQMFFHVTIINGSAVVASCLRLSHTGDETDFSINFLGLMRTSVSKNGKISRGGMQFIALVIMVLIIYFH